MVFQMLLLLALFLTLATAASLTSPPSGAVVVRQSGTKSGEFSTISAAIKSLDSSSSKTIFIYPGTYTEQVYITRSGALTIRGYTTNTADYASNQVTITFNKGAQDAGGNDQSGTLRVAKSNFAMYNVNVKNTYGNKGAGSQSQAIALSAYGSQQAYYACQFTGYQDTVLANTGTQYFGKSYIEGAVDYIFGQQAKSYFKGCTIASTGQGYITASGRDSTSNPSYYVFDTCTVRAASSASSITGKVYLGRPWRNYARVVFMNSNLSNIINAAGWSQWSTSSPNTDHVTFGEYNNSGAGAWGSGRAKFATKLGSSSGYGIGDVLGSSYTNWVDPGYL
ncbi:hypothetical protein HDV00_012601 [Rhizophlyctis rosea]|nr:hypothetical protein HDV00_012601 [Rhizophlyctis rosea]